MGWEKEKIKTNNNKKKNDEMKKNLEKKAWQSEKHTDEEGLRVIEEQQEKEARWRQEHREAVER